MTRLRLMPRADAEIRRIDAWWRRYRSASPDLFVNELAEVFSQLTIAPQLGRPYPSSRTLGVRRLLLRATRYHVYFEVNGETVSILAVWSAVRRSGPRL